MRSHLLAGVVVVAAMTGGPVAVASPSHSDGAVAVFVSAWLKDVRARSESQNSWAIPAGDLDGDGGADVAIVTEHTDGRTVDRSMTVRRGATGTVLWRYDMPADDQCGEDCPGATLEGAYPVAPRAYGGNEFLVVRLWTAAADPATGADRTTLSLDVRALDHTGAEVWRVVRSGTVTETDGKVTADHVPMFRLQLDGLPGPADDVLVGARSGEYPSEPDHHPVDWHEDFALVSGDDGAVTDAGSRDTTTQYGDHEDRDEFIELPDVSGDGLDDYVIDTSGFVSAYQGSDAAELWHQDESWFCRGMVGDVTGDGLPDLLLESFQQEHDVVEVVDGATGTTVWRHAGSVAWIGMHGEVWVSHLDHDGSTHHAVAEVVSNDGTVTRRIDRTYRLPAGKHLAKDETFTGGFFTDGDVNADGVVDLDYSVSVYRSATATRGESLRVITEGMLDGRNGRTLWTGRLGLRVVGSVDARGDDLVDVTVGRRSMNVTPQAGDTGRPLWSASIPGTYTSANVESDRFDTDNRADLLVYAYTGDTAQSGTRIVLYSGVDGHVLWYTDLTPVDAPRPLDGHPVRLPARGAATTRGLTGRRLPATGYDVPGLAWLAVLSSFTLIRARRRTT